MRAFTRQSLALSRVEEFRRSCAQRAREMVFTSENQGRTVCVIYGELEALGPTPNPEEVERITGQPLESESCDECGCIPKTGAVFFELTGGEDMLGFFLCAKCLNTAAEMLEVSK